MPEDARPIQVYLNPDLDRKLKDRAKATRRNTSDMVRALLEWALDNSHEEITLKPAKNGHKPVK